TPQVIVTKRGDDVSALAARARAESHRPIVAGGGDGTANVVGGTLAGTDGVLGVLPMGTLNHFAKDGGIPLKLDAAVRNLFTGQVTKVDVGEVNGRIFVNNSGVGFYPHFVRARRTGAPWAREGRGVRARPASLCTTLSPPAHQGAHGSGTGARAPHPLP